MSAAYSRGLLHWRKVVFKTVRGDALITAPTSLVCNDQKFLDATSAACMGALAQPLPSVGFYVLARYWERLISVNGLSSLLATVGLWVRGLF